MVPAGCYPSSGGYPVFVFGCFGKSVARTPKKRVSRLRGLVRNGLRSLETPQSKPGSNQPRTRPEKRLGQSQFEADLRSDLWVR
jgi:hypothetical protein